jgi:hypothetical protein
MVEVHYHIENDADPSLVAGFDEELRVDRRPHVEVRCEIEPGSIAPVERLGGVLDRQQFDAVDSEIDEVFEPFEDELFESAQLGQWIALGGVTFYQLHRQLIDHDPIVLTERVGLIELIVPAKLLRYPRIVRYPK